MMARLTKSNDSQRKLLEVVRDAPGTEGTGNKRGVKNKWDMTTLISLSGDLA
jgi:hypothetical protein